MCRPRGARHLRPYILVQFFPLLAIPLLLLLCPPRYSQGGLYLVALGTYALAKGAEVADSAIFHLTGVVSGHMLKHLLGAAAVGVLVAMLARRRSLTVLPDLSWAPPGPEVRTAREG